MHIKIKELPVSIQKALLSVGYGRTDIAVNVTDQIDLQCSGGAGVRGFAIVLNLDTGESKQFLGSWGGANPFNPTNRVDLDSNLHTIPVNGAVIKGHTGNTCYASVYVSQANVVKALDAPKLELTDNELGVLKVIKRVRSGYRKDYFFGYESREYFSKPLTQGEYSEAINCLSAKGLIKINKAMAVSITTEGKNAATMLP